VSAHTIVVGTKTDLRSDPSRKSAEAEPFTKEDGERLAKVTNEKKKSGDESFVLTMRVQDVGARMYVECSSFTQDGLKNVFEQAVRVRNAQKEERREIVLFFDVLCAGGAVGSGRNGRSGRRRRRRRRQKGNVHSLVIAKAKEPTKREKRTNAKKERKKKKRLRKDKEIKR
jgi:hypothetical protein